MAFAHKMFSNLPASTGLRLSLQLTVIFAGGKLALPATNCIATLSMQGVVVLGDDILEVTY
jgi:hypothetical protein